MFVDWRNLPAMTDAVQMAGWVWRGICVWDKGISRNQPGRFRNDCEYIVWASNGDMPIDWKAAKGTKAMPGVYHVPIVAPKQRQHQTEKPVELLEGLLAIAPADGLVLDAFMGSGSTGVACMNTGRRFAHALSIGSGQEFLDPEQHFPHALSASDLRFLIRP